MALIKFSQIDQKKMGGTAARFIFKRQSKAKIIAGVKRDYTEIIIFNAFQNVKRNS